VGGRQWKGTSNGLSPSIPTSGRQKSEIQRKGFSKIERGGKRKAGPRALGEGKKKKQDSFPPRFKLGSKRNTSSLKRSAEVVHEDLIHPFQLTSPEEEGMEVEEGLNRRPAIRGSRRKGPRVDRERVDAPTGPFWVRVAWERHRKKDAYSSPTRNREKKPSELRDPEGHRGQLALVPEGEGSAAAQGREED